MALNHFFFERGANGEITFARPPAMHIDARVLAADTNEAHTVPAGADIVEFSADGVFWAKADGAVTIPAADVTDGSAPELNPASWVVRGVTAINVRSAAARKISLSFYKTKTT